MMDWDGLLLYFHRDFAINRSEMRVIMERVCTECRKKYRRFLVWLLAAGIIGCAVYYIYAVKNLIPDTINLNKNSVGKLNFNVPFVGTVEQKETGDDSEAVQAYATNVKAVNVNLLDTLNISTGEDRKSTRLNSSHMPKSRMPSSA